MSKRIVFLTMLFGIMLINLSAVNAQNLILNPGFEDWTVNGAGGPPDNWALSGTSMTASQEGTIVDSGTYSVNVTWTTQSNRDLQQTVSVTAGTTYILRYRAYDADTAGRVRIWGYWRDSGGGSLGSIETAYTDDEGAWTTFEVTAEAPIGAVTLDYYFRFYDVSANWDGDATVYIDNVELLEDSGVPTAEPTAEPTAGTPLPTATPGTAPDIMINEIWYDDPGTDTYGFVELYGPPFQNLDNITLQEFNQTCTYDSTLPLDGFSIPADGYFVVGFIGTTNVDLVDETWMNQLQNGPCDGVRLLYYAAEIDAVQWGTDCDPGCGETFSAPEPGTDTNSMGRYPDHSDTDDNLTDFCEMVPNPGQANTGCYSTPTPEATLPPTETPEFTTTPVTPPPTPSVVWGEVVINEIMYDSVSGIDEEWVELYNTTSSPIDVSGWCLSDDDSFPVNSGEGYLVIPPGTTIAANGYLVLSEVSMIDITCEVVCTQVGAWGLGNSGDNLSLWTSDDGFGIIIDGSLSGPNYPDDSPGALGYSIEKWPEGTDWFNGAWYASQNATSGTEHVNHTACGPNAEPVTPVPTTTPPTETPTSIYSPEPTPSAPPTPGFCGDNLLLNASFETWTAGIGGPPDNWTLTTTAISATQESSIVLNGSYSANLTFTSTSTQYITQVVAVNEGDTYDFNMWVYDNDPGGRVRLWGYWQDASFSNISTVETGYSVDMAGWQYLPVSSGDLVAPAGAVYFAYQIRLYDVSPFPGSATIYVDMPEICGNAGVPPTATPTGPSPTPSETPTAAPSVSIYDIQYTTADPADSPYKDQGVRTRGVVTAIEYTSTSNDPYVFIQDGDAPWNGLLVYVYDLTGVARGDLVEVQGIVKEYFGMTEISPTDIFTVVGTGTVPDTALLGTGLLDKEPYEGCLVRYETVQVTDPSLGSGEWEIDDTSGATIADDQYSYDYIPLLNDNLDFVQGPLLYSFSNFKVEPRDNYDISSTAFPTPTTPPSVIPATGPAGVGIMILIISILLGIAAFRRN